MWNVRGLNSPARRAAVSVFVSHNDETKMSVFDLNLVKEICGASFSGFAYSPSDGASGGLLIAWADDVVVSSIQCSKIFNSAICESRANGLVWQMVNVYGPQFFSDKMDFLADLQQIGLTALARSCSWRFQYDCCS